MTLEKLLEIENPQDLEQMNDAQLLTIFEPCLKNVPPIDIQIVQQARMLEEQKRLEKKLAAKALKIKPAVKVVPKKADLLGQLEALKSLIK